MRRKPTAAKALAGTLRRDRTNPLEPRPPAGAPPARRRLPMAVRREYDDLVQLMTTYMPGVATLVDVVQLELTAAALAEYRKAVAVVLRRGQTYAAKTAAGAVMHRVRPEVAIAADAWRRAHAALQNLGLSPVSRPKVEGTAPALGAPATDDPSSLAAFRASRFFRDGDDPLARLLARRQQRIAGEPK